MPAGTITLRTLLQSGATTKGTPLTYEELDSNFLFLQSGTGATSRTVQARLRDLVSVLDFIPVAEHAAIAAQTSTTILTTYIQAALDEVETNKRGGLYVPAGLYNTGQLNWPGNSISLIGASTGYSGGSGSTPRTVLRAVTGTSVILELDSNNRDTNYIADVEIDGNNIAAVGIDANVQNLFERVRVRRCTTAGIRLNNITVATRLIRCNLYSNTGYGLLAQGVSTTIITAKDCYITGNTNGGVRLETGFGVSFENCVMESNGGYGLGIYRPATHTNLMGNMHFKSCWFEDHQNTAALLIDAENRSETNAPQRIKFELCQFSVPSNGIDYMDLLCGKTVTFDHCHFDNSTQADALNIGANTFEIGFVECKQGRSGSGDGLTTAQLANVFAVGTRNYVQDNEVITTRKTNTYLADFVAATERRRLTDEGFTKLTNNGSYADATGDYHEIRSNVSGQPVLYLANETASSPIGIFAYFAGAAPNDNTQYFLLCQDSSAERFRLNSSGSIQACAGTAIPAGGTAGRGLMVSSTSNFGVFFGSGAPTLSAAQGSLYLRSDGSSTSTRAYINTDGGTTWTAITTAA